MIFRMFSICEHKKSENGNDIHDILDLFKGWRRCLPTSTLIESLKDQEYHEYHCLFQFGGIIKSNKSRIALQFSLFLESKVKNIMNSIAVSLFFYSQIENIVNINDFSILVEIKSQKNHEYHCLFHSCRIQK